MRFSQKPIVILGASLVFPPAGLILLWMRQGTSVLRKSLGSLAILVAGVAHLFLFYGLHMEFSGGIRPVFSFQGGERHYRQLEAHRVAFQAPAPAIVEATPAAAAAPVKAASVPAPATGSTYWADFLGPGRLGGNGPRATPVWDDGRLYALGAEGELRCLESATGKLIWNKNILADNGAANIHWGMAASPLVVAPNRVYLSSAYGHGAAVLELTPLGGGFQTRVVWSNNRMNNKFNSAVLYEGYLYGLDDGILACVDVESGERTWKGGRYGYGQLLLAGGHLVVLTGEGEIVLVHAPPEKLQEVARFSALEGKTWNIPAISDGLLLVRNEVEMAAFRIAAD